MHEMCFANHGGLLHINVRPFLPFLSSPAASSMNCGESAWNAAPPAPQSARDHRRALPFILISSYHHLLILHGGSIIEWDHNRIITYAKECEEAPKRSEPTKTNKPTPIKQIGCKLFDSCSKASVEYLISFQAQEHTEEQKGLIIQYPAINAAGNSPRDPFVTPISCPIFGKTPLNRPRSI